VALIIRPGLYSAASQNRTITKPDSSKTVSTLDSMLDIVRNMFPENLVQACSEQITTVYETKRKPIAGGDLYEEVVEQKLQYVPGTNVMGLVVFCILFGIFISNARSEAQIIYDFFLVLNELIMKIVGFIMW
jgi:Na+/H+-dicarboxylate symporter